MAWKYNPFTDALDQTGSGGGTSYIDGDVEYHSNLPVTVGAPAVNSAFLVRKGEGLYFVSRKPAGIWVRELNNGNLDDWKYAGTFSDLYRDANFRILNNTDITKELAFDVSGVATGTTRTLTVPNASGTIARTETFAAPPSIGNTTPAAGSFTTLSATPASGSALTLTGGTVTASAPLIDASQTWNNAAVTFTGLAATITNTASNAASLVSRFTVGSTNVFEVDARGFTTFRKVATTTDFVDIFTVRRGTTKVFGVRDDGSTQAEGFSCGAGGNGASSMNSDGYSVRSSGSFRISSDSAAFSPDVFLRRDAAGVFAQYNGTNTQESRLYGTFTSSTNYQRMTVKSVKQTLSALSGASATTTGTFIPDGAVVVGVTTRVATALTGAAGYTIGDGTDADRWGDITGTAIGTTSDNRDWTAGTIECFTAGGNITLTAKTSNFTAGAIEICVFYLAGEAD